MRMTIKPWNRLGRDKTALFELADKPLIDELPGVGLFRLRDFLDHEVEQRLAGGNNGIGNRWHSRLRELVSLIRNASVRDSDVLGLELDRNIAVGEIAVCSFVAHVAYPT